LSGGNAAARLDLPGAGHNDPNIIPMTSRAARSTHDGERMNFELNYGFSRRDRKTVLLITLSIPSGVPSRPRAGS